MKLSMSYLLFLFCLICVVGGQVFAGLDTSNIQIGDIQEHSITINNSGSIVDSIALYGLSILKSIKIIAEGILIIYLVYTGIQMVTYMGEHEDDLSQAKRQIWYILVALIFINIPGTLYQSFRKDNFGDIGGSSGQFSDEGGSNLLVNTTNFEWLVSDVVGMLEVAIASLAILVIVYSGLQIMSSGADEEKISNGKLKIFWSIIGLIFIGFIESVKRLAITGDVDGGYTTFNSLIELILFFVGPVTIFFIILAGYYYITSNGDEERAKKGKNILFNTLVAIVLLLATYTFFGDLASLF